MFMDPHPSQQHAGLQHAVWWLQWYRILHQTNLQSNAYTINPIKEIKNKNILP